MTSLRPSWLGCWRFLALATILLFSACNVIPKPEPLPAHLPERGFTLVLPVYNEAGLTHAVTTLKPYIRAEDRFMIVSGNNSGVISTTWVNRAALTLRTTYPNARLYAATSGIDNFEQAARQINDLVEALVYIYEPNFSNEPEFTWDFDETLARFSEVGAEAGRQGFRAVGKPTGRPLLQPSLRKYAWDYGELADTVDELLIQTQTYCKDGAAAFLQAIDTISRQYQAFGQIRPWFPQVTIDPTAQNGTSVAQARACLAEARAQSIDGTVLWWAPQYVGQAVSLMQDLNRSRSP